MRISKSALFIALLCSNLFLPPFSSMAYAHDEADDRKKSEQVEDIDVSDAPQTEENLLLEKELEEKKAKKRKKDIIVYSCFALSLFMLLWIRKRRRTDPDDS